NPSGNSGSNRDSYFDGWDADRRSTRHHASAGTGRADSSFASANCFRRSNDSDSWRNNRDSNRDQWNELSTADACTSSDAHTHAYRRAYTDARARADTPAAAD